MPNQSLEKAEFCTPSSQFVINFFLDQIIIKENMCEAYNLFKEKLCCRNPSTSKYFTVNLLKGLLNDRLVKAEVIGRLQSSPVRYAHKRAYE